MRTFCPLCRFALSISACQAVKPTRGIEAASSIVSCFGLIRYGIFSYRNEFRESTDSILIRPRIDLVARLESPHSRSDSDYDSGEIIAQNER